MVLLSSAAVYLEYYTGDKQRGMVVVVMLYLWASRSIWRAAKMPLGAGNWTGKAAFSKAMVIFLGMDNPGQQVSPAYTGNQKRSDKDSLPLPLFPPAGANQWNQNIGKIYTVTEKWMLVTGNSRKSEHHIVSILKGEKNTPTDVSIFCWWWLILTFCEIV